MASEQPHAITLPHSLDDIALDFEAHEAELKASSGIASRVMAFSSLASTEPEVPKTDGVYYVNLTPKVADQYRQTLIDLQQNVADFRSWATTYAANMTTRKIKSKELDSNDIAAVSSYRCKALDYIYGQRNNVMNVSTAANNTEELDIKTSEFHANILKVALKGFPLDPSAVKTLDEIIVSIVESLKNTSEKHHKIGRQYFILAMYYIFDDMTKTIRCQLRTVNFKSTESTFEVATRKSTTRMVRVSVAFSGYNYDFNQKLWIEEKGDKKEEIEKGKELMKDDPTYDVPV